MNIKFLLWTAILFINVIHVTYSQGVAINNNGSTPHQSAMLDIQSTSKGVLIPKMTTDQRTAISSPATGLLVFDTDTESFWFRGSSVWVELTDATSNPWQFSGNNIFYNGGNVGIGDSSPNAGLTVGNGDKFQVDLTRGNLTFTDDSASIRFPPANALNTPMIQLFTSGTQNADRMIFAHSAAFPKWGMEYKDTTDKIFFRSANDRSFTFELSTGNFGVGTEDPAYPIDFTGRMRIRSAGYLGNSPGIWFSSVDNEFNRALFAMSGPDSTLGIWSQHLNKWAIEFELMREPRLGINIPSGSPPRSEIHVYHDSGDGACCDGVRIQNTGSNGEYWNLYTDDTSGDFLFYQNEYLRSRIIEETGVFTAVSDETLKTGIRPMEEIMPKVMALNVKRYQFRDDPDQTYYYGLLAQELEQVFPENTQNIGDVSSSGIYTVDYSSLSVVALKAIQEQQAEIEKLKAEIEAIKKLAGRE